MKKIGLDLGKARVGIAMSDILGILASPFETWASKGMERDADHVAQLVREYNADLVVCGLPLNLDGSESFMTDYAKNFVDVLKQKTSAKIVLQDERLSSVEAEEYLNMVNKRGKKRKAVLDQVSACIILQSYLDANS